MRMGIMMKKRAFCMLVVGVVAFLAGGKAIAAGLEADMVIYNGKILTIDSPDPNGFTVAQGPWPCTMEKSSWWEAMKRHWSWPGRAPGKSIWRAGQ